MNDCSPINPLVCILLLLSISSVSGRYAEVDIVNRNAYSVPCPGGIDTDTVAWQMKKGSCDAAGIFSPPGCKEDGVVTAAPGATVKARCTSGQIPDPGEGTICFRITWCGASKTLEYTGQSCTGSDCPCENNPDKLCCTNGKWAKNEALYDQLCAELKTQSFGCGTNKCGPNEKCGDKTCDAGYMCVDSGLLGCECRKNSKCCSGACGETSCGTAATQCGTGQKCADNPDRSDCVCQPATDPCCGTGHCGITNCDDENCQKDVCTCEKSGKPCAYFTDKNDLSCIEKLCGITCPGKTTACAQNERCMLQVGSWNCIGDNTCNPPKAVIIAGQTCTGTDCPCENNPDKLCCIGGKWIKNQARYDELCQRLETKSSDTAVAVLEAGLAGQPKGKTVNAKVGEKVFFDMSKSHAGDQGKIGYWNMAFEREGYIQDHGEPPFVEIFHTYDKAGTYTAKLQVRIDYETGEQKWVSDTVTVNVVADTNEQPTPTGTPKRRLTLLFVPIGYNIRDEQQRKSYINTVLDSSCYFVLRTPLRECAGISDELSASTTYKCSYGRVTLTDTSTTGIEDEAYMLGDFFTAIVSMQSIPSVDSDAAACNAGGVLAGIPSWAEQSAFKGYYDKVVGVRNADEYRDCGRYGTAIQGGIPCYAGAWVSGYKTGTSEYVTIPAMPEILVHEIIHTFGLGHSSNIDSIMGWGTNPNERARKTLDPADYAYLKNVAFKPYMEGCTGAGSAAAVTPTLAPEPTPTAPSTGPTAEAVLEAGLEGQPKGKTVNAKVGEKVYFDLSKSHAGDKGTIGFWNMDFEGKGVIQDHGEPPFAEISHTYDKPSTYTAKLQVRVDYKPGDYSDYKWYSDTVTITVESTDDSWKTNPDSNPFLCEEKGWKYTYSGELPLGDYKSGELGCCGDDEGEILVCDMPDRCRCCDDKTDTLRLVRPSVVECVPPKEKRCKDIGGTCGCGPGQVCKRTLTGEGVCDDCCAECGVANQAPFSEAEAGLPTRPKAESITVPVNSEVEFDGSKSHDLDGKIVSYEWDYGDGSTADGAAGSHKYAAAGTYTAYLTVTDDAGGKGGGTVKITVIEQGYNRPPVAIILAAASPVVQPKDLETLEIAAGTTVHFSHDKSYDTDGRIVSYRWDFSDDGSSSEYIKSDETPSHVFRKDGSYTVTLTVKDDDGATATDSIAIRVLPEVNREKLTVLFIPMGYDLNSQSGRAAFESYSADITSYFIMATPLVDCAGDAKNTKNLKFSSNDLIDVDGGLSKYKWEENGAIYFYTYIRSCPAAESDVISCSLSAALDELIECGENSPFKGMYTKVFGVYNGDISKRCFTPQGGILGIAKSPGQAALADALSGTYKSSPGVAVHELSHTFGLKHCNAPGCVMNPGINPLNFNMGLCSSCTNQISGLLSPYTAGCS